MPVPKIRIVHLLHRLGVGGQENGVVNLLNNIDAELFESYLCSFKRPDWIIERVQNKKITTFVFNKRQGNDLTLVWQLWALFRTLRPHVVHTHGWGTLCEGLVAAKLTGVPVIIHGEHGTIQERNVWFQRQLWSLVDQVVSVSASLRRNLAQKIGFPIERILAIQNGVDIKEFCCAKDRVSARASLGATSDEMVIGTAGTLTPVKDHATFLRALAIVAQRFSRFKAVIIGGGPLAEELSKLAVQLRIHSKTMFLGFRNDMAALLSSMDIFVLSSLSEGMPNVVLEAMACGLPIVGTNVGGMPEIVEDGETGLLTPPGNPDKLAHAIFNLIQDSTKRRRFGEMGQARVRKLFALERMVKEYESLYIDCTHRKLPWKFDLRRGDLANDV
jgi:sugar transferase (PEP-CTERM/EpsH1 system associated)